MIRRDIPSLLQSKVLEDLRTGYAMERSTDHMSAFGRLSTPIQNEINQHLSRKRSGRSAGCESSGIFQL